MATTALPGAALSERESTAEPTWPLYAVLFASLSIVIGLMWDISWHRTIGRDTFWSPPHVLEQLAALVAGASCGWVVLRTTFAGTAGARARSVSFWGFRGPLGAWICIWGTLMMIASAPFDDWWHNAYGLDVKILSPPHMVLAWGMISIQVGAMITALARQNRANADESRRLGYIYIASAAILLCMHATVLMEEARFPHLMHWSRTYQVLSIFFPLALVALARPARLRWPATTAAALYMALDLTVMWVLQLSPAEAKLAPIFNPVTHMVPQPFPLLLVVPAVAIDLLLTRTRVNDWVRSVMIGVAYVAIMLLVHWFFSEFLLSPAARNVVFGADKWDYNIQVESWRYEFWRIDSTQGGQWDPIAFGRGLLIAVLIASMSARIGLVLGKGMARIQR